MDAAANVFLLVSVLAVVAAWVVRLRRTRRHAERRERERRNWQARVAGRRERRTLEKIRRYYPYLESIPPDDNGTVSRDTIAEAIRATPGIVVGTGMSKLPVVLPDELRTRHQVVVGRSGSGKTTHLNNLLTHTLKNDNAVILTCEQDGVRHVLPRVPMERAARTVHLAPGSAHCPTALSLFELEQGADRARAASDLYHAFKLSTGETSIGGRSDAIARNLFAVLVGTPGASFLSFRPFLEDPEYRQSVLRQVADEEILSFWRRSFEQMPQSAALPILSRVSEFTTATVRKSLCAAASTFSLRSVLDSGILLIDLSALSPDAMRLAGAMLLSRIHLELVRRDERDSRERPFTALFIDEFHMLASATPAFVWKDLCARSRRMNLGLCLLTQSSSQIPREVRDALFSNVSTFVCFSVSSKEAAVVRKELPVRTEQGEVGPIKAEKLVSLPVGIGYARIGGSSALAMRVRFLAPEKDVSAEHGERVKRISWENYAANADSIGVGPEAERVSAPRSSAIEPPSPDRSKDAPVRVDSTTSQPAAPPARPVTPRAAGRGGDQHRYLQHLLKKLGGSRGYRATIEKEGPEGSGRVDVVLENTAHRIAVEVSVTSSAAQEMKHITASLAAGFDHVVVVSNEKKTLRRIEKLVAERVEKARQPLVRCLTPDGFLDFLDEVGAEEAGSQSTVCGYRVRVGYRATDDTEASARQRAISKVVASTLKRTKS